MLKSTKSRAIKLFGTKEKLHPQRVLVAGDISAVLDNGSLRYIRYQGVEVLRAINFLVRNKNWATYNAAISQLKVKQSKSNFTISYKAICKDEQQEIEYSARIEATGNTVKFHATGLPKTNFQTKTSYLYISNNLDQVNIHKQY